MMGRAEIAKTLRPRLGLLTVPLLDGPLRDLSREGYSTSPESAKRGALSGVVGAMSVVGTVRPLSLPMLLVRVVWPPPPPMLLVLPLPGVS